MKNKITVESLAVWIAGIKECAKQDTEEQIFWFVPTMDKPFTIVAGWQKLFDFPEVFCTSKSQPAYVMCIKIAENKEPCIYPDFDSFNMPLDKNGEVDDTCVPLEWDDSPEAAAEFFLMEWERIMKEHGEEV